jgi:hypothetical protein
MAIDNQRSHVTIGIFQNEIDFERDKASHKIYLGRYDITRRAWTQ